MILPVYYKNYLEKVDKGFQLMSTKKVVVCALARNNADKLPSFFSRLACLEGLFKKADTVLVENDSTDNTAEMLEDFKVSHTRSLEPCIGHTWLQSEKLGKKFFGPDDTVARAQHMAECRNKYLKLTRGNRSGSDFVIVVDADLFAWEIQGLANSFGWHEELKWNAMFSNGLDIYRDNLIYYDTWSHIGLGATVEKKTKMPYPMYHEPVPVKSGFGGLAIYEMSAILAGEYSGLPQGAEHCGLHDSMERKGYNKFYINPSQTTLRMDKEILKGNSKKVQQALGV